MELLAFLRANAPYLAAGLLLTFASSFGQTFFIAVFSGEIRSSFGLSHGAWGSLYAAATTASALTMIWAGTLADRFRVRALGAAVVAGLACACLGMAAVPSVWLLPLAIYALRMLGQGMVSHTAMVAMARWFVARRGRALSIAAVGVVAGQAVLPVAFVALMIHLPWRLLWVLAALILLAILPVVVRLLRQERTPREASGGADSSGLGGVHWRRAEVVRHWLFWMVVPALLGPAAFGTAFFFLQVHLAEAKGWSHMELVALFPLYTTVSMLTTVGSGWVIDKVGTARLMPLHLLPMGAGFLLFGLAGTLPPAGLAVVLMALTHGAALTVLASFWAEFYGTRHIGAIKAMGAAVMVFGTALGPGLTGWLIDLGLTFPEQMPAIAGYFLAASALAAIGVARAAPDLPRTRREAV